MQRSLLQPCFINTEITVENLRENKPFLFWEYYNNPNSK